MRKILKAAKKLIEKGWCQERNARNADSHGVSPHSVEAIRWCAVGAVWAAAGDCDNRALALLSSLVERGDIIVWNDAPTRTQQEVIDLFDKAIKECGE